MVGAERGLQRADRLKPQSQTKSQSDHRDQVFSNSMKPSHAMWGHPIHTGHSGEVWQYVVHRRREWQTNSVFLPREPHEQYERQKDRTLRWTPQVSRCSIWYRRSKKNEEMEPKQTQDPVVDVTGDGTKVQCCKKQYYMLGPWIKANWKCSNRRWQEWTSKFLESVN